VGNRPDRRRTKHAPAVRVEAQHRVLRHRTASIQDRVVAPSREEMRRAIANGDCPFCGAPYVNIAGHTYRAHGVSAVELKDMAGIPKTRPACTPELSAKLSEISKQDGLAKVERMRAARNPHAKRKLSAAGIQSQREKLNKARAARRTRVSVHDDLILTRIRSGELAKTVENDLGINPGSVRRALRRSGVTDDLRQTNSGYGIRVNPTPVNTPSDRINAARAVTTARYETQAAQRLSEWDHSLKDFDSVRICAQNWRVSVAAARRWLKLHGVDVPNGRAAKPRMDGECGTMRGYRKHRRDGDQPCPACRAENARVSKARRVALISGA